MVPGPGDLPADPAPGRRSEDPASDERRVERRHPPVLPGFAALAARRQALVEGLVARRVDLGLTQTEVAARMGTSQSAVARLETGDSDARLSTIERYAAAVGQQVDWTLTEPQDGGTARGRGRGR